MAKNIVICCDGTGNEFEHNCNSNVVKLYSTLIIGPGQVGYYHPGVGTMGAPAALTWYERAWTTVLGLAFGYGLLDDVGRAYGYLMQTYEPGDCVFLFGFSRGAYTVRALASMLRMFGLLYPGNEPQIPYVLRMFKTRSKGGQDEFIRHLKDAEEYEATFARKCHIHFIGVWDTVSSVGWIADPLKLPYTAQNYIFTHGRQALSIDERRCYFRQNQWGPPLQIMENGTLMNQDIKQVWFAGVHSDVGGSYPEMESGLSKITLEWMLVEAIPLGLQVDRAKAERVLGVTDPEHYAVPDPLACKHESLHGAWWIPEFLPHRVYDYQTHKYIREIPLGRRRRIPGNPCVHQTVELRMAGIPEYKPPNLPIPGSIQPWRRF